MKRKENMKEHDSNCPKITDYLYKIIITPGSESGKTNSLFNLISYQSDVASFFYMLKIHMKQISIVNLQTQKDMFKRF